jgi:hypothetical protein
MLSIFEKQRINLANIRKANVYLTNPELGMGIASFVCGDLTRRISLFFISFDADII